MQNFGLFQVVPLKKDVYVRNMTMFPEYTNPLN